MKIISNREPVVDDICDGCKNCFTRLMGGILWKCCSICGPDVDQDTGTCGNFERIEVKNEK